MLASIFIGGILIFFVYSVASYVMARREREERMLYYTAFPQLERIGEIVYAKDQYGTFIGQGKTKGELIAAMTLNLPGKQIAMDRAELEKVGF